MFSIKILSKNTNEKNYFTVKENMILKKCQKFYLTKVKYMKTFLKIIDSANETDNSISLRSLDWFVTNFSKKDNTHYNLISPNDIEKKFYVHIQYKNELNMFTKQYFDPFCRKRKISCTYEKNDLSVKFTTSIGQLNFLKWAIKNQIITYVEKHLEEIKNDQNETNKLIKKRKKEESEKTSPGKKKIEDEGEFGMSENSVHLKLSLTEKMRKKKRYALTSPKNPIKFTCNHRMKIDFSLDD